MEILKLKIGRNEYSITADDKFMNNGCCVQLLTQSKEKSDWGKRPNPILSKRAIKEIDKFEHRCLNHIPDEGVTIFKLIPVDGKDGPSESV